MDLISELWGSMAITGRAVVTVLAFLSVYSYAVMLDRFVALRGHRQRSDLLAAQLEAEQQPEQIRDAARDADPEHCALAAIVLAGIDEFEQLHGDGQDRTSVREGVDDAVGRELDVVVINLRARLSGMATISGVAPFLGLFGTVTGLIAAFRGIAETGSGGLATVSGGISEALVTTVIGLFVAIPALWAYNYFMERIDVTAVRLDNTASRIVQRAVRQASPAAGD